jgi:hypothetical protein
MLSFSQPSRHFCIEEDVTGIATDPHHGGALDECSHRGAVRMGSGPSADHTPFHCPLYCSVNSLEKRRLRAGHEPQQPFPAAHSDDAGWALGSKPSSVSSLTARMASGASGGPLLATDAYASPSLRIVCPGGRPRFPQKTVSSSWSGQRIKEMASPWCLDRSFFVPILSRVDPIGCLH